MKALSIKQPWASLICIPREDNPLLGIKDIENRTWKTHFRGRIYIHASADLKLLKKTGNELYTKEQWLATPSKIISVSSAIIGEVDIIDCVMNHESIWAEKTDFSQEDPKSIWNWVLANPILYDKPILNIKGALSFWEPKPNCECMNCGEEFFGQEPQYCCDGNTCGCMGQPIEPVVCSGECYDKLMKK